MEHLLDNLETDHLERDDSGNEWISQLSVLIQQFYFKKRPQWPLIFSLIELLVQSVIFFSLEDIPNCPVLVHNNTTSTIVLRCRHQ